MSHPWHDGDRNIHVKAFKKRIELICDDLFVRASDQNSGWPANVFQIGRKVRTGIEVDEQSPRIVGRCLLIDPCPAEIEHDAALICKDAPGVDRAAIHHKMEDDITNFFRSHGAYYSIERTEAFTRAGVTPVIPPPAHAVVHGDEDTRWHDQSVKYIRDKGIYAFHKKYGYGLRSRVEAQISRIKRCIGATLLTQKIASQECEGVIIANLINLWNAFGKPVCVKNA